MLFFFIYFRSGKKTNKQQKKSYSELENLTLEPGWDIYALQKCRTLNITQNKMIKFLVSERIEEIYYKNCKKCKLVM